MKKKTSLPFFLLVLALFGVFCVENLHAAMTGGNFTLYADTFANNDVGPITGGNFQLFDTVGEFAAADLTGGTIILNGGFQAMEPGGLSLSLSTANLGFTLPSVSVTATTDLVVTVDSSSINGYNVTISEDGNLRKGPDGTIDADNIDDVADGTIDVGTEEYGVIALGVASATSNYIPITGVTTQIINSLQAVIGQNTTLRFGMAVNPAKTQAGTYSHLVTLTATANP